MVIEAVIASVLAQEGNGSISGGEQLHIFSESLTESLLVLYVNYLTFGIDIAAGLIIGISAILAFIAFLKILRKSTREQTIDKETIRLRLDRGLLLALDFEVGSDILKTILVPSVRELTILAVIVGVRIALSWSLSKEIDRHSINLKIIIIISSSSSSLIIIILQQNKIEISTMINLFDYCRFYFL
jgi:uncharacterized membrane protein